MIEEWKPIVGYEGLYEVSNLGRVKSLERIIDAKHHVKKRILKQGVQRGGYLHVGLCKNNKVKIKKIHRLVAEAFIPNPYNLPQVNHKDENIKNNCVDNLEWCTGNYNYYYGTRIKRIAEKKSKSVVQYNTNGEFIKEYSSVTEAECAIAGKTTSAIHRCLHGKSKTAYGYKWKYKE